MADRERELYRRLLDLGEVSELRLFLDEALALAVEIVRARQGYLALYADDDARPASWTAYGCSDEDVEEIRERISAGIVAAAMVAGETIRTASAVADPRFSDRASVRANRIEAVLCAPIGGTAGIGVLYLQGRLEGGVFSEEDQALLETFARRVRTAAVNRIAEVQRSAADDPTTVYRQRFHLEGLVGRSEALAAVFEEVAWVAPLSIDVLVTGPSGSGKSTLAGLMHANSPRRARPFIVVPCTAIPETLFEGEFFGAVKGAFTDAITRRGYVASAEGGTLFLDEIGDMPLSQQAKLLQFLQTREYSPVGAAGVPTRANVRVVAATNVDLAAAVAERRFREDLLYRLDAVRIRMPSLEDRREDIVLLARTFVADTCKRHSLPRLRLSPSAETALEVAVWRGDVRELSATVQRGVLRAHGRGDRLIQRSHLFTEEANDPQQQSLQDATRSFQRSFLRRRLEENDWNVTRTAKELDVARSHLYSLVQSLGLRSGSE